MINETFITDTKAAVSVLNLALPSVIGVYPLCKLFSISDNEKSPSGPINIVEDVMIERGANYSKKESWASFACKDGNLITGQNPASSEAVAELLLKALN